VRQVEIIRLGNSGWLPRLGGVGTSSLWTGRACPKISWASAINRRRRSASRS